MKNGATLQLSLLVLLLLATLLVPAALAAQKKGGGGTAPPADPAIAAVYDYTGGVASIVVMNSDGTNATILSTAGEARNHVSFSPSGSSIAFTTSNDIRVIDLIVQNGVPKAVNERVLIATDTANGLWAFHNVRWSPAGHEIAFWIEGGLQGQGIYTIPASGGQPTRLIAGESYHFCWSPDGTALAAADYDHVSLIDRSAGTAVSWQVAFPGGVVGMDWGRTNCKLVLGVQKGDGTFRDLMVMNAVEGAQPTRLFANGFRPVWSPDDRNVAYIKRTNSGWVPTRRELATGAELKLYKSTRGSVDWRRF